MNASGHIYGVVLNDRRERNQLAPEFAEPPYAAPPLAPVIYMKPASSIASGPIIVPAGQHLRAAPTLALLFARDASSCAAAQALDRVGAVALAIDLSLPQADYYRPAVAVANRDGFLALGQWQEPSLPDSITLASDCGQGCTWSLADLVRQPAQLVAEISAFMTLRAGDMLLVGLPGDAPLLSAGRAISVSAPGFPALALSLQAEPA